MDTLPRYESEIDTSYENGEGVARLIAEQSNKNDSECFSRSGEYLTILEPSEFAGNYEISVDYDPVHYAERVDDLDDEEPAQAIAA